jgi:cytochrome c
VSRPNILVRFLLFPLGVALLTAASLFQEGTALSVKLQSTPSATLSPFERLAEPTLPATPGQADHGAQTYWLLCLPCHGERGQGLTDEFRETYPPEEQYCWERGCHGERPYDYGFKLPMKVPALIGPEAALGKFTTAARLNAYIRTAMPFWKPGSLTEEESWLVTAFLLRENGIQISKNVDASNAEQIVLSLPGLPPTPMPEAVAENAKQPAVPIASEWLLALALVAIIIVAAVSLRRRPAE